MCSGLSWHVWSTGHTVTVKAGRSISLGYIGLSVRHTTENSIFIL